ncbi:protease inhibitor I42 family protein [Pseudomonas sp. Marseille-QA0892]
MKRTFYLLAPLALALGACTTSHPDIVTLDGADTRNCAPLVLDRGQMLILSLPSNPTTGYRWVIHDDAAPQLESLGPEVYSNPKGDSLIGADGQSTWRFKATTAGDATLRLAYQRPWESDSPPSQSVECTLRVQ